MTLATELDASDLEELVKAYKARVQEELGRPFPEDVHEQLWGAIGAVFGSWMNQRAVTYRRLHDIPESWGTAVTVMTMFPPERAGILLTEDPNRPDQGRIIIEAAYGLGEAIVSGEITPDHYVVLRDDGAIVEAFIPDQEKGRVLADHEVVALRDLGLRLEAFFASPQDVEWCFRGNELLLLQSRPITTLGVHG